HAEAPVKIQQIHAAAQQNVLAIVDRFRAVAFGSAYRPGCGAATGEGARFVQIHAETGAAECGRRSQSGKPGSEYCNAWFGHSLNLNFIVTNGCETAVCGGTGKIASLVRIDRSAQ